MGDVAGGHRQHRHLRQRAGPALDASGALVQGREVAVEVAGIPAPARNLAARRRHLADRLRIAGHVRDDDQDVAAELERQMLGDRERDARRDDPLDKRIVGGVEQQRQVACLRALLERVAHSHRVGARDADGCEHDGERRLPRRGPATRSGRPAPDAEARRPRRRAASGHGRASPARRSRRRRSGSASRGVSRAPGLIGLPATLVHASPRIGGPPSSGSPRPLQTRPSHASPTGIRSGLPANATRVPSRRSPSVPSKTCTTARSRVDVEDDAVPHLARVEPHLRDLVPADLLHAADDDERPAHGRGGGVLDRGAERHSSAPSLAATASYTAATPWTSPGGGRVARAGDGREVDGLDRRRGHALVDEHPATVDDAEDEVEERRLLGRLAVRVVLAERALLEDRLSQQPAREQRHALARPEASRSRRAGRSTRACRPRRGARAPARAVRPSPPRRGGRASRRRPRHPVRTSRASSTAG